MKNLLYKEFKLSISPLFFILTLFGALLLIPSWVYSIALMYVLFITIPNIFTASKAQKDIGFSVMLPVKKRYVVKARILSIAIIEILHIIVAAIFGIINIIIYPKGNFFLEPNIAFFGLIFIMFAIFNFLFFTIFYKTGYKIAVPIISGVAAAFIFFAGVESLALLVPTVNRYIDSTNEMYRQLPVLFAGIALFVLSAIVSYKVSAKRFEKVDV